MVVAETLPSGLRLVTEAMPHVRSVTVGVWLTRGSRHESDAESGVAHFVEHMLFKGTTSRSAQDIAQTIDSIGGQLDAFTAKEYASYYIKVLDEHLPLAIDLLSDMVLRPALAPADVAKEQSVILEEIKMVEDAPDDLVHEVFAQQFWSRHPLGRPILGTPETVSSFDVARAARLFRADVPRAEPRRRGGRPSRSRAAPRPGRARVRAICPATVAADATEPPAVTPGIALRHKDIEQSHLCLGTPAYHAGARRSARAVRAEHDSRRLDELAALPAHSRGARPGLRGVQQSDDLQRRRHDDRLRRLRDRQGRARSST